MSTARAKLVKKLDKIFSEFIRLRDSKNGMFKCCSCGAEKPYEQADAGHFINRRWMATRWDETNVHAQCSACNRFDEGNSAGYALFMLIVYDIKHIEHLQNLKNSGRKYTEIELQELIDKYKLRLLQLKDERGKII